MGLWTELMKYICALGWVLVAVYTALNLGTVSGEDRRACDVFS